LAIRDALLGSPTVLADASNALIGFEGLVAAYIEQFNMFYSNDPGGYFPDPAQNRSAPLQNPLNLGNPLYKRELCILGLWEPAPSFVGTPQDDCTAMLTAAGVTWMTP